MLQVINIRTLFNDNYRFANLNSLTVEGIGYGYWVIESKMNGPVFQFLPTYIIQYNCIREHRY